MNSSDLRACAGFATVVLIAIAAFACIVAGPHPAAGSKRYQVQAEQPQQPNLPQERAGAAT